MDPNGEQAGKAFLAANKARPGVTTLASGLQYRVLEEGGGLAHPKVSTPCECHYVGRLLDGTEFDNSYKRGKPSSFAPNQVIPGWTEAMQLMVQGDKWEMYIPFELAYGARGKPPRIPPAAALIFVMEIVQIKGETTPKASSRAGTSREAREEGGKAAQARDGEGRSAEAPKRKHESETRQRDSSSDSSDSDSSSDSEERRRKKHKKEKREKKEKKRKGKHKSSKGKKEKHKKDKGKRHKKEASVERSVISGKPILKKLDKTDEDHARDAKRQQLLAFLNDAY